MTFVIAELMNDVDDISGALRSVWVRRAETFETPDQADAWHKAQDVPELFEVRELFESIPTQSELTELARTQVAGQSPQDPWVAAALAYVAAKAQTGTQ